MCLLIAENRLGLNLIHAAQAADFLQVLPVIARTKHIILQILIHFLGSLVVIGIQFQVF